jgi:ATP-dependent RNA helicase RhlE
MIFQDLGIIEPILRALHEEGYRTPTPIQQQAIPIVLQGKDLLGVAQTGTGKTAAFAVPILQLLSANSHSLAPKGKKVGVKGRKHIRCLILTPTRELAVQIEESFEAYGRHLGISSLVIFGGVKQGAQTSALHRGVDIVVATPGRLLDLMDQGFVDLRHVEIFVLDEADRMLDMGFVRDVRDIIAELPENRQTLFFSATMPAAIVSLAGDILDHPVKISITPPATTVDMIRQSLYYVEKSKKPDLLLQILEDKSIRSALVFTRTKRGADVVARTLERNRINAEAIHGNKAQNARQRALTNFKAQKTRVLVATDIAARGIDVDDLEYVINYEIPNVPETYVHRIGRTGRAGASGTALSFCSPDEKPFIRDIEKLTGKKIPVAHDHPFAKSDRTHEPHLNLAKPQQHSRQGQQHSKPQQQHPKQQHSNRQDSNRQDSSRQDSSRQDSSRQDGRQHDSNSSRPSQKPAQHSNQKPKADHGRRRKRW